MTETLAQVSNNALYSATVVYALAMLAHVAEWAMARQLPADPGAVPATAPASADAARGLLVSAAALVGPGQHRRAADRRRTS